MIIKHQFKPNSVLLLVGGRVLGLLGIGLLGNLGVLILEFTFGALLLDVLVLLGLVVSDGLFSFSLLDADVLSLLSVDFLEGDTDDGTGDSDVSSALLLGEIGRLDLLPESSSGNGPGDLLGLDLAERQALSLLGQEEEASSVLSEVTLSSSGVDSVFTECAGSSSNDHFLFFVFVKLSKC